MGFSVLTNGRRAVLSAIWYKTIKLSGKMNAEQMFALSDLFYAAVFNGFIQMHL